MDESIEPSTSRVGASANSRAKSKFYFVCPNGHRLKGPSSLRGKPGQCPHCSAKFLVPTESVEGPANGSLSGTFELTAPPQEEREAEHVEVPIVEVIESWRLPAPEPTSVFPIVDLVTWIWEQRDPRAIIELQLKDGLTFVVKQFAPQLSRCGFGVFASVDDYGKHTLTCIAWDQVTRVMVRGLDDYPRTYFT